MQEDMNNRNIEFLLFNRNGSKTKGNFIPLGKAIY